MTSEQPLPMSPNVALKDALYFADHHPGDLSEITEVVQAAQTLALAIEKVKALEASRIGASDYLAAFDGDDLDGYSFYHGVAFALTKVRRILAPWEPTDD